MEKGLKPVQVDLKQALFHDTGASVIFPVSWFFGIMKKKSSSSAEEDDLQGIYFASARRASRSASQSERSWAYSSMPNGVS